MSNVFVNYLPAVLPLGAPLKCDPVSSVQPVDGPWRPHSIPGYEIRRLAGGADEVRAIPGTLPSASVTQVAPAQPQRDDPYIPPGWDSFTYHDHKGHDTTVTRPAGLKFVTDAPTPVAGDVVIPPGVNVATRMVPNPAIPAHAWPAPEGATHWDIANHTWRKPFRAWCSDGWDDSIFGADSLDAMPSICLPLEVPAT